MAATFFTQTNEYFKMAKSPIKLDIFNAVTTTKMEIKPYGSEESTGVFLHGYTPDSKEWRELSRKRAMANSKPQKLMLGKKGANYIELDKPKAGPSEEDLLLIDAMTDITGIDGFKFEKEAVKELMLGDWYHVLDQWREHLDDRQNFTANVVKSANDG